MSGEASTVAALNISSPQRFRKFAEALAKLVSVGQKWANLYGAIRSQTAQ